MKCNSLFATALLAGLFPGAAADQVLLEAAFNNTFVPTNLPANGGISFWSGGNFGKYPDGAGSIPVATNGSGPTAQVIQLAESSFGQIVAQNAAFPGAVDYFVNQGETLIAGATAYKRIEGQTGDVNLGGGAWDIRFPGVVDQLTGTNWVTNPARAQNYFPVLSAQAEQVFRACLRINPYDIRAARGVLGAVYEQMAPLMFAANNNAVYASRRRLTSQDAQTDELPYLNNAMSLYRQAASLFIELANRPSEATFLLGTSYFGPASAITNDAAMLLETFGRSLALRSEMALNITRLKYYATYLDPVLGSYNAQSTLSLLADKLNDLQAQLLVAGAFVALDSYRQAGFGSVDASIGRLQMDRDAIMQGRIFFSNKYSQSDYPPHYIPFLWDPLEYAQFPNSFRKLIDLAKNKAAESTTKDAEAGYSDRSYDSDLFQLQQRFNQIQSTYRTELGQLCGQTWQTNDQQVAELAPDVLFALFPPGSRELQHYYTSGESKGQIYAQYGKIDEAETQYQATLTDLTNILASIQKKQDIAAQVASIYNNTASLILTNGEKIVTLDQQIAEIQAEAARAAAAAQAKASKKSGLMSIGLAIAGFASGGLFGALPSLAAAGSAYAQASATMKVGNLSADSIKQIAEIEAQKTRIRTMESAYIQFQTRDIELLKTEEMVFSMMLDAERLKLNIMMAKQRMDMEQAELANLLSRVNYLLQEYQKALVAESYNPLTRPDFRLLRDIKIREAEDKFTEAQEWAYLAAKAGEYRVNGSAQAAAVRNLVTAMLAARSGSQLQGRLSTLENEIDRLYLEQGPQSPIITPTISVRNYLIQNNAIIEDSQGNPIPGWSVFENQGNGVTSDTNWVQFLQAHTRTNGSTRTIEFSFSTSLNMQNQAGDLDFLLARYNPLFNETLFDGLITYTTVLPDGFGTRINLKGRELQLSPGGGQLIVRLRQEGASHIRSRSWASDATGTGVNVWNLEPREGLIVASLNGFGTQVNPQFHERSPANDRWVLSISSANSLNNALLLSQLHRLTDIEIQLSVRGFTGP